MRCLRSTWFSFEIMCGAFVFLAFSGCVNHNTAYSIYCSTDQPREQCERSGYSARECGIEEKIIESCAGFVAQQASMIGKGNPDASRHNNMIDYQVRDRPEFSLGFISTSYGSKSGVYLVTNSESGYVSSIPRIEDLVRNKIEVYDAARSNYFSALSGGHAEPPRKAVIDSVESIDELVVSLQEAKALGKPFLEKVAPESDDFERNVRLVVQSVNSSDVYLRRAADKAVKDRREYNSRYPGATIIPKRSVEKAIQNIDEMISRLSKYSKDVFLAEEKLYLAQRRQAEIDRDKAEVKRQKDIQSRAAQRQLKEEALLRESKKSMACQINPEVCE